MKFFTHPKKNWTRIQLKDGRTYSKNWVYFRNFLRHGSDEKYWKFSKKESFKFEEKSKKDFSKKSFSWEFLQKNYKIR